MWKDLKPLLWVLAVLLAIPCVATVVYGVLNGLFHDFKGRGENESWTVEEARDRGILVTELDVEPREIEVPGGRIRFEQAWIEERSLTTPRFVWFTTEKRIGGYRLQFTLADEKALTEKKLYLEPEKTKHRLSGSGSMGRYVWYLYLDFPEVTELRMCVRGPGDELLAKNIRFIPKRSAGE